MLVARLLTSLSGQIGIGLGAFAVSAVLLLAHLPHHG